MPFFGMLAHARTFTYDDDALLHSTITMDLNWSGMTPKFSNGHGLIALGETGKLSRFFYTNQKIRTRCVHGNYHTTLLRRYLVTPDAVAKLMSHLQGTD